MYTPCIDCLLLSSKVVVNSKVPRRFFTGGIGDIQHQQVQYAFKCKVPNKEKEKFGEGL